MKRLKLWLYFFSAAGVLLLAIGVRVTMNQIEFRRHGANAPGVVIENVCDESSDGTCRPKVRFRTEAGREIIFVSQTGSQPPKFHEGEPVVVLYDRADPSQASINTFGEQWIEPLILGGLGSGFLLVGGGAAYAIARSNRIREWLLANGTRVTATCTGVELKRDVRVNGRSPYRIQAQWLNPATSLVHVFESPNLWFDPRPYFNGPTVDVLIDPNNPTRHYMDTGFLPRGAR